MDDLGTIVPDRPVVIGGPTACGKSALALRIARTQGGVIVNADALQIWSCWRVLSARPSPQDEADIPHLLYGHKHPGDAYSVGHWLRDLAPILAAFKNGGPRPIIIGGTGLYLSALTEGLADIPPTPAAIRQEADAIRDRDGHLVMAQALDPQTAARVDLKNPMRVQRAWEVQRATGRGLAHWQDDTPPPLLPLDHCQALVIDADRDWLATRIDRRFDIMLKTGTVEEVQQILPIWDRDALWAKAIGAPEIVAMLRGEISASTAREQAQAATRQYAKRQRTWFRARLKKWQKIPRP